MTFQSNKQLPGEDTKSSPIAVWPPDQSGAVASLSVVVLEIADTNKLVDDSFTW